jgi:hypothetical protein
MECLVADLRNAVDDLQGVDAATLTDDELSGLVVALHTESSRLEAARVSVTGAWDARRVWDNDGAKSGGAWLAHRTHRPRSAAHGEVHLARRLRSMPATATALAEGAISADHARRLARANRPGLEDTFARDEGLLVGYARELSWADFNRALAYWEQLADPDGSEDDADAQHEARRAHRSQTLGGTWVLDAILDPIGGAIVDEILTGIEQELFEADWAAAKAEHGDDVTLDKLARTPAQRRADALVEMAIRAGTAPAPADGRRPRPLFTVLIDYPTMAGRLCELANGTVIAPGTLAGWLSEADIERVVFDGASRIIDIGTRSRFFTGATRRAVQVRDRRCTWPGCDTPGDRCEIDHVVPYADGGETTQANGTLRCPYHHRWGHRRTRADPTARQPDDPRLE